MEAYTKVGAGPQENRASTSPRAAERPVRDAARGRRSCSLTALPPPPPPNASRPLPLRPPFLWVFVFQLRFALFRHGIPCRLAGDAIRDSGARRVYRHSAGTHAARGPSPRGVSPDGASFLAPWGAARVDGCGGRHTQAHVRGVGPGLLLLVSLLPSRLIPPSLVVVFMC